MTAMKKAAKKPVPKPKHESISGTLVLTVPEVVLLSDLKPHPRNYKTHPPEQIAHLKESLREHGVYRNIVVARDGTILAGHGVAQAARELGLKKILARRMDIDPASPEALKIVVADNELPKFAEVDDRMLSELLLSIQKEDPTGLLGTGYDERNLAALVMVTQAPPVDPTQEWEGMPEFDQRDKTAYRQIVLNFKTDEDAAAFGQKIGQHVTDKTRSLWYPKAEIEHLMDKRYRKDADGSKS